MEYKEIEDNDCFEYAIILSLLSRKPIKIINVKSMDLNVELLEYFKLVSPGSEYLIKGETIKFNPSGLIGNKIKGKDVRIPLCLKNIIVLCPFLADNLELELTGITNYDSFSVDVFKITFFKIFRAFNLPSIDLTISKRGFAPDGDGVIVFKSKSVKTINEIVYKNEETLSKIRGFVITSRIGLDHSSRMINTIKNELSDLANTKVLSIVNNRNDSGPSPGYECSVMAESNNGVFYETMNNKDLPEKMALECCKGLLESISQGGIFDQKLLPIIIIYMGMANGVSHLEIGKLDKNTMTVLKLLNIFFNINHKIVPSENGNILTVFGCRYSNIFMPINKF